MTFPHTLPSSKNQREPKIPSEHPIKEKSNQNSAGACAIQGILIFIWVILPLCFIHLSSFAYQDSLEAGVYPSYHRARAGVHWSSPMFNLFLNVESWTLTLTERSGACSFSDVVLLWPPVRAVVVHQHHCYIWSHFWIPVTAGKWASLSRSLLWDSGEPGKVRHSSKFPCGSQCGLLESQRLRNGL